MSSKKRILLADDDPMLRQLAGDILSDDYEVLQAVDGQDAWEKAHAFQPDLVVTDIMMPRMHGYELCQRLKGPEGIKGVRILVASAKSFATDRTQAEQAGADAYLVKPYKPADLIAKVEALLSGETAAPAPGPVPVPPPPPQGMSAAPPPPPPPPPPAARAPQGPASMRVRFWGTRGSCPVPGPNTVRYGGNTSCIEVRIGDLVLILDCGTGVRELGKVLMREFKDRPIEGHIFVGHTHWDHIQGFPFFAPLYDPRNTFNVYSVRAAHGSLQNVFGGSMASDYFPIPLTNLAGKLRFVEMAGPVDLGAARVSFCHLNHPGVCIGFRIDSGGRSVTYLGDRESHVRLNGDSDVSRRQDADLVAFSKGSDLLIAEAQYTEEEYPSRKGWGHSTFDDTVRCAMEAGVKRLAFFHHDPDHFDDEMDSCVDNARTLALKEGRNLECFGAQDGMVVDI